MAKAHIEAGICGSLTDVVTTMKDDGHVSIEVDSTCLDISRIFSELTEVDPFMEIGFFGRTMPTILKAKKQCPHASCPVFSGVIKAVEVEAGLALPKDALIQLEK